MRAVYENHYLSDTDVANYARQSFAKLAENFTEQQNNNLIRFLARGMASGDWDLLIQETAQFDLMDRNALHQILVYSRALDSLWPSPHHATYECSSTHPHAMFQT